VIPIGRDELFKALEEFREDLRSLIIEEMENLKKEILAEVSKDAGKHKRTDSGCSLSN
jgi:hypothetical protein